MSDAKATDQIVQDFFSKRSTIEAADVPAVALNAAMQIARKADDHGNLNQTGIAIRSLASATDELIARLEEGKKAAAAS